MAGVVGERNTKKVREGPPITQTMQIMVPKTRTRKESENTTEQLSEVDNLRGKIAEI